MRNHGISGRPWLLLPNVAHSSKTTLCWCCQSVSAKHENDNIVYGTHCWSSKKDNKCTHCWQNLVCQELARNVNEIAAKYTPPNTPKQYLGKIEEFCLFCQHAYPNDPYKFIIRACPLYRFFFYYTSFRQAKKEEGRKKSLHPSLIMLAMMPSASNSIVVIDVGQWWWWPFYYCIQCFPSWFFCRKLYHFYTPAGSSWHDSGSTCCMMAEKQRCIVCHCASHGSIIKHLCWWW